MQALLLIAFAVSGFTGLIYESVWSHYLKLFLGHAAYAQSLVLAIFMGGMALGAWIASRRAWRHPLLAYAAVEALIGVLALGFHQTFTHFTEFAHTTVFPALASPAAVQLCKWVGAGALILPQSILLGMTFPLISAGLIRGNPAAPGAMLAVLYFANSLGAAIGAPVSGFVLIDQVGLPGTILTAGLLNILLALCVWLLVKDRVPAAPLPPVPASGTQDHARWHLLLLAAAFFTGAASLIYEIGWIRMLSLVLGSSTHAFELMLSAFILGLALGGLWMRSRLDRLRHPLRALAYIQIVMGVLAMATLPLYGMSFEFMQWLLQRLARSDGGYLLFNLASHAIALAVMLPATFAAGMTLPLITYALIQRGAGERSIGQVYAMNTLGSIIGVVAGVHLGLPYLGLKGSVLFGAAVDMGVGIALLWALGRHVPRSTRMAAPALALAALVAVLAGVSLDSYKMASGVYRSGRLLSPETNWILYHQDGKTATVDVIRSDSGVVSIATNGKVDAAMALTADARTTSDEWTMVLLAAVPLAAQPGAKTAANIGIGSGLTSHILLQAPWLERVDTIEIEPAMVQAAKGLGARVQAVFTDPRSRIHIEDAKTFFSARQAKYDIIVSEPSNPWVSGVASLFSDEFYRLIRRHLNARGVFVQWLQLYEIDDAQLASVIKAIDKNFAGFSVYFTNKDDMLVLATGRETADLSMADLLRVPELKAALSRISIHHPDDIKLHRLGSERTLKPYFGSYPVPVNSDYFPFLDLNAARTRYLQEFAADVVSLAHAPLPVLEMLERETRPARTAVQPVPSFSTRINVWLATKVRDYYLHKPASIPADARPDLSLNVQMLSALAAAGRCGASPGFLHDLYPVAAQLLPYLSAEELRGVWASMGLQKCKARVDGRAREWLELFEAVGNRDAKNMAKWGAQALAQGRISPQTWEFALAAAMTGSLVQGDRQGAAALWERYGAGQALVHAALFRVLRAQLAYGPQ